jgi:hypothetical protein
MSQAGSNSGGGGPTPPAVPTQFTTDINGPAIPVANNLNVYGQTYEDNIQNGLFTNGVGDTLYIGLSNRIVGSVTTVGATTSPIVTFNSFFAGVGTYTMEFRIAAYNTTATEGAGYSVFGTVRYDGVNSNLCGTPDKIVNEEGTMANPSPNGANVTMTVSGADVLINGVGYTGQNINWVAVGLYTYVGA